MLCTRLCLQGHFYYEMNTTKALLSEISPEKLKSLSTHKIIGEWRIVLPQQSIDLNCLYNFVRDFNLSFSWLEISEITMGTLAENPSLNPWNKSAPMHWEEWFKTYDLNNEILSYTVLSMEFSCIVKTKDVAASTFPSDRRFGEAWINYENDIINFSITFYVDLFTQEAFMAKSKPHQLIDIGFLARKHNRKCLSDSLHQFEQLTNGEITHWETEIIDNIDKYGFNEKNEVE
jgi:hypothetical protein